MVVNYDLLSSYYHFYWFTAAHFKYQFSISSRYFLMSSKPYFASICHNLYNTKRLLKQKEGNISENQMKSSRASHLAARTAFWGSLPNCKNCPNTYLFPSYICADRGQKIKLVNKNRIYLEFIITSSLRWNDVKPPQHTFPNCIPDSVKIAGTISECEGRL